MRRSATLPEGTVTFLLTDLEESAGSWRADTASMAQAKAAGSTGRMSALVRERLSTLRLPVVQRGGSWSPLTKPAQRSAIWQRFPGRRWRTLAPWSETNGQR